MAHALFGWRWSPRAHCPGWAGIETHVHEVSTRLGAAGVDVTVLTTDPSGELPQEENLPGYRVRRWRAYPRSRDYFLAPGLARHLLQANNYDVIHIQGVHNLVAPTALAQRGDPVSPQC